MWTRVDSRNNKARSNKQCLSVVLVYDRLKCRDGGLAFGVEVIKHEHTDLGAVLLYLNNQHLVVAAYTIDSDQLPRSDQVLYTCCVSTAARLARRNVL